MAQPLLEQVVAEYKRTGEKQRWFTHFNYQADTWDQPRVVIVKAECQAAGTNLRFVVTNLEVPSDAEAERHYDDYTRQGECRPAHMREPCHDAFLKSEVYSPKRTSTAVAAVISASPLFVDATGCKLTAPETWYARHLYPADQFLVTYLARSIRILRQHLQALQSPARSRVHDEV